MASLIKVLFVVGNNESLRRKLLRFWDELTSTTGWRLTGYGSWAVEEGSVPLPGLMVVTARETSCLQCFPASAEAILLAHDFVRVRTIMGHQSVNARYFRAPGGILPTVRRSALPNQALNYPSMFKVVLGGQSANQAVPRGRWQGFWYRFTETRTWQWTRFTHFSFQNDTVLVAAAAEEASGAMYTMAQEILQAHGFRATLPETAVIPEFQSPADIPDVKLNDFLTHPRSRLVKVFFVDGTGPGVLLPRPRLRRFMDALVASEAGMRAGYNWNFSRDHEILFSAGSDVTCFNELARLLRKNGFAFLGHREDVPAFQAPLIIPEFCAL
ncbi:unnamed protein product [Clonostachys byssicola]|uniref:Uncharacterized protein n=1 Tax=Clonostachys byssicola TaxID=160290 RepID=A0A9N9Y2E4_9HYPO|nr:unnamed protein product [Clonostachys byssicola]